MQGVLHTAHMHVVIASFLPFMVEGTSAQTPGVIMEGLTGCDFTTGRLLAACIPVFIGHIIQLVISLIGSIFVINVMIGGYQYAIGSLQGDGADKGKNRIFWSIIGLIAALCSYLILDLVLTLLGI